MADEKPIWVDPVGGLGDILMLSTALKRSFDAHSRKFRIVRRTQYTPFFRNHPAVEEIGNPTEEDDIVCNDYWSRPDFDDVNHKALQILFRIFAVPSTDDDTLYLPQPGPDSVSELQMKNIPWREKNVLICFSSESPRKMMHPMKWHVIVEKLLAQQCFVVQAGRMGDIPIRGAYSLLGTTTPAQLIEIVKKCDLVITPDNFIMHAAKLAGTPAIALFGPTEPERYGYKGNVNLRADLSRCPDRDKCLGPKFSENYPTQCPLCEEHCMNSFDESKIVDIAMSIITK